MALRNWFRSSAPAQSLSASRVPGLFCSVSRHPASSPCPSAAPAQKRRRCCAFQCGVSNASNDWHDVRLQQHSDLDAEWQAFLRPDASRLRHDQASTSSQFGASIHSLDDWDVLDDDLYVPRALEYPSVSELTQQDKLDVCTVSGKPGIDLFSARGLCSQLAEGFVILFGVGQKESEGIYSLRVTADDGLPRDTIIAFESEEDADRYAGLLEATMDHLPNVCSIQPYELLQFCSDAGYSCRLEQQGTLLIPPHYNVNVTDWERSLRLREGKFSVLKDEPEGCSTSLPTVTLQPQPEPVTCVLPSQGFSRLPEFSAQELDIIKAKLESLLPAVGDDDSDSLSPTDDA